MPVPLDTDGGFWLFGYGSIIWKPDLPWDARRPAALDGWARRFWQGSHDHRGTPEAPGRVVTLVEVRAERCEGVAYRVPGHAAPEVLDRLDHREKNGYERHRLDLLTAEGPLPALVYVAPPGNFAWLGEAPETEIARQIHGARGPSGHNRDYLLELDRALGDHGFRDDHVRLLASLVEDMSA